MDELVPDVRATVSTARRVEVIHRGRADTDAEPHSEAVAHMTSERTYSRAYATRAEPMLPFLDREQASCHASRGFERLVRSSSLRWESAIAAPARAGRRRLFSRAVAAGS